MTSNAYVACVLMCGVMVAGSGAPKSDNDFASTLKFSTGAADPKTPLAMMPHFLAEMAATDGDATPRTAFAQRRLVATKERHRSQMYDMSASPSVYRETADGREYRDYATPPRAFHPGAWQPYAPKTNGVARKPYKPISSHAQPSWEPAVYKPSNKYHRNQYVAKPINPQLPKDKHWPRKGFNSYERPPQHLAKTFPDKGFNSFERPQQQFEQTFPKKGFNSYERPQQYFEKTSPDNGFNNYEPLQQHFEKSFPNKGFNTFERPQQHFENTFPDKGFNYYEQPQQHFEKTLPNVKIRDPYNNQPNNQKQRVSNRDKVKDVKTKAAQYPKKVNEDDEEDEDEEQEKEFVPMRMYAQVRQYESESHLPSSVEEPRLRKIVKDSRIHTVYMEEGYEDGAYDHAGEEKHAENEEAHVEHRRKRRSIDFTVPSVDIDDELLDKSQYALGQPADITASKYPYYDKPNINSNSPLRYSQAIADTPNKKENNMAFYDDAAAETKCEEVVDTVTPIPKDLDAGEQAPEKSMIPNLPRLRKLGDKIDCYKIKFFGEEPLDNPLFREELIEQPKELFAEPEVWATANHLKHANRTGKSFQSPAVEESSHSVGTALAGGSNQDASDGHTLGDVGPADANVEVRTETGFQPLPEAEALRMQRVTRPRKRLYHRNKLNSSPYSAYRPLRKSHPPHKQPRGSTPPPPVAALAPNTISEVYYKQQIKPSEQLNVFADVINHIQNMSRDDAYMAASEQRPQVVVATPQSTPSHPARTHTQLPMRQRKKSQERKRKIMKPTQQLYKDYMRRNATNSPSRIQNDVLPLAQESNVNVGTVHVPNSYESLDFHSSYLDNVNAHIPSQYTTIDVPLNKYIVPGMKPPLAIEKPMIYSDYQSTTILKRRDWISNHRLTRRKRAMRNNYSEIRRQPARKPQESDDEDEDIDDYVPHRPTNYHYDPDTDRIIYDKKPTSEKSVEDIVEEYFEEEPEPPESTTKKPPQSHRTVYHKDALNKANGKTLVDYLAALRADPSYKLIEDPKPTTDPPTTTTLKPESTTPPEFLRFLEKLHTSDGYKKIENPEEDPVKKKPKTTTTEAPVIEEEEEEEEPVQAGSIQNSPGGQFGQNGGLQIFDINDYLPKVKTYTPKTSIDYSKYKTIERTTSRHSLSSRYSEEDELPLEKPTEAPLASKYQTAPPRPKPTTPTEDDDDEEDELIVAPTTTSTTTTTTTSAPKIRVRTRQRPTRRPTRATTTTTTTNPQSAETNTEEETTEKIYTPATHRPPSRVYPRRHRPKIRLRPTTPSSVARKADDAVDSDEEPSEARRRTIVRRREHKVPANHKPNYTPVTISKRMDDLPTLLVQRQSRLVTPDIINYNQTADGDSSRPGEINPRLFALQYKVARLTTPEAGAASRDKDARAQQINNDGVDLSHGNANADGEQPSIDRSDHDAGVKFIKDPNKRLYFYAPL